MMLTCICGKEFVTEADPHVVLPTNKGAVINCGCFFTKELEIKISGLKNDFFDCIREVPASMSMDDIEDHFKTLREKWIKDEN